MWLPDISTATWGTHLLVPHWSLDKCHPNPCGAGKTDCRVSSRYDSVDRDGALGSEWFNFPRGF